MTVRWLYHLMTRDDAIEMRDPYSPPSLSSEGFVHCSYRDKVRESARLYFPADSELVVLRIDPRRLQARVREAATPRGPMPHVHGPIPSSAIVARLSLAEINAAPDFVG